jgi:hypothetical protein
MFIGHDAVGFASKRFAPRTSLGWLIAAPLFLDLIWPVFLLLGIEHVRIVPGLMKMSAFDFTDYPWSHSLLMSVAWGVLCGGVYVAFTRYVRGGIAIGIGVVSHWVCDLVVHRADLPLYPGGAKYGFGLWNHPAAVVVVEFALYAGGIAMYCRTTTARDRAGTIAMWAFIAFLAVIFAMTVKAPPPPSVAAVAYSALALWLLPVWAAWFDRHRAVR